MKDLLGREIFAGDQVVYATRQDSSTYMMVWCATTKRSARRDIPSYRIPQRMVGRPTGVRCVKDEVRE